MNMLEPLSRFWDRVEITPSCWIWRHSVNEKGYGYLSVNYKHTQAYRFSYELFEGKIPDGLTLDHLCKNRRCVNPAHLQPTTNRDNILRGDGVTAKQSRQDKCKFGHKFEGNNLIKYRTSRYCRECCRKRSREYMRKKRLMKKGETL